MIDLTDPVTAGRLLDVIEHDVVPLTRSGVELGNKIFGAALLHRETLELVIAETNNETENPLWHGEIHTIKRFFELPASERPAIGDVIMLATHEPCSLCLSGVAWSGIPEFAYLFSHEDSAESFAIPYDIAILKGVYAVPDPDRETAAPKRDLYNRVNDYFTSHDLADGVRVLGRPELNDRVTRLAGIYDELSAVYQQHKGGGAITHA
ncbi:nucleoside deaminase [Nocardioides sp. Kera G14]|uniref:nucleoside deaminase n=1 Tax=Nocardioides sp. Kera G14 TaxID=2884264 RepID=UPI001D12140A|nr:nucleoside deaminase [Nocardioides sp. Kera G14]UDY24531.1 nucleoside deaminase [Nocardioides sp. Kera G14]